MHEERPGLQETSRREPLLVASGLLALGILGFGVWQLTVAMPGSSYVGTLPPAATAPLEARISESVRAIVGDPAAPRSADDQARRAAVAAYLAAELGGSGELHSEAVGDARNLYIDHVGDKYPDEIVVVGANYDTVSGSPGADTNASGCAALLWLASEFAVGSRPERTVRYALFTNKEPPHYHTETMGSLVHARAAKARGENIVAMLNLQSLGVYSDVVGSQKYPFPLSMIYPDVGNFVAFVGDVGSRSLVRRAVKTFRARSKFPSEGAALPAFLPGIGWSDHWAFWQAGYPAIMASDTAMFRSDHFGEPTDTVDKLDFERLARVTLGLADVVSDLASGPKVD